LSTKCLTVLLGRRGTGEERGFMGVSWARKRLGGEGYRVGYIEGHGEVGKIGLKKEGPKSMDDWGGKVRKGE